MEIEITWYKDSMKDQVITLFENQYNTKPGYFSDLFENFYFHPYQKNKCLLIVALDGSTVVGFQSFFHWPYTQNNKDFNSFQSGNSLVHPNYRGKGLFQKMLAFIDKEKKSLGLDFFVGFPIEASIKNLLKDKWQNILDLKWFIRFCNPFGFIPNRFGRISRIDPGLHYFEKPHSSPSIRLSNNKGFTSWRKNYLSEADLRYTYRFKKNTSEIIFHIKKNKRKFFNEIIIGNVLFNSEEARSLLVEALKKLHSDLWKSFSCHFISCAINTDASDIANIKVDLETAKFKKINKSIYFAVKPFKSDTSCLNPTEWELYRSDIDTW